MTRIASSGETLVNNGGIPRTMGSRLVENRSSRDATGVPVQKRRTGIVQNYTLFKHTPVLVAKS